MDVKNNPAGRLYDILDAARHQNAGDTARKAWAAVFQIDPDDTGMLLKLLADVIDLVHETKSSIQRLAYRPTTIPNQGYRWPTEQRGGALVATRYIGSDPVEIAHIVIGPTGYSKGGGGGVQTTHKAEYDPATSADLLKTRFVDRSKVVGVEMQTGKVTYTSPATLTVGNGGFPYELSAQLIWRGGKKAPSDEYQDNAQPQTPWTTNWNNSVTVSGSGLAAMGDEDDPRAATPTIAAFLMAQNAYSDSPSLQRDITAVLANSWWVRELTGNVVTATIGAKSVRFLKDVNGNWYSPGADAFAATKAVGLATRAAATVNAGKVATTTAKVAAIATTQAATGAASKVATNAVEGKSFGEGTGIAAVVGATVGTAGKFAGDAIADKAGNALGGSGAAFASNAKTAVNTAAKIVIGEAKKETSCTAQHGGSPC